MMGSGCGLVCGSDMGPGDGLGRGSFIGTGLGDVLGVGSNVGSLMGAGVLESLWSLRLAGRVSVVINMSV